MNTLNPHSGQPVLRQGPNLSAARIVVILVHGRGGSAADMLDLAKQVRADDVAYVAPQAGGSSWYPHSFLSPISQNEPGLSAALNVLRELVSSLEEQEIPPARMAILGFSQGACLAIEFAARHARRYAAIVGLSGGLVGPPGTSRNYAGSFDRTPMFLGCSDNDPHIPLDRVHESAEVFRRMGASVDERIYPRMAHTVNQDELLAVQALLTAT